ncbi:hypothetical protein J2S19_004214 [Metabacillus malikii]|uniref:Uncharacterized protein n=1 Tax=Metabacillus malikii TaxID=1504265 RepID=A0ABT9ZKV7_9BACI|nr:hypothetical protein [Metabacillus malikii]
MHEGKLLKFRKIYVEMKRIITEISGFCCIFYKVGLYQ